MVCLRNFINVWYIWLLFGSITHWGTPFVYLCACLIACYVLYYFITFSLKRKYCNKDCNREGVANGTQFWIVGIPFEKLIKIKIHSDSEKEEKLMASLLQHSTLLDILNTCCCRDMFVWQTIDDRIWYWQWTLKTYCWWSNILEVENCCWYQTLFLKFLIRYCCWVADVQTFGQVADARYLACHYCKALLSKALLAIVYCTVQ